MTPVFDLQGGIPLCVARAATVGALLSIFGALVFGGLVAPRAHACMDGATADMERRRFRDLVRASALAGLVAALAWLVVQAGTMADADGLGTALRAVPKVLAQTSFGRVLAAQIACLAALAALAWHEGGVWRRRAASALATAALVLQAGHSHAWSMDQGPSVLLGCDVLHLLGAGAWLGGLVPLLMLVRAAPPRAGAAAARWFSPVGQWAVAALVVSAAVQGWVLVASLPGLVGTAYGWMVLVKLTLSAVLLGFAAANRYRFAPALLRDAPVAARRGLVRSIALQTGFAVAITLAAAVLSGLPPSMHEQALWPFAERLSLSAIDEDPDFRREVVLAGAALAGGLLLLACSLVVRRLRLAAGALAAVIGWFAVPHFDLLLVTAYPTSFYRSPSGFAATSIVAGQAVYAGHCAVCHGADGRGDGPAARSLPVPPADLTAAHLWMHSDGELFWWLTAGIRTPEGSQAMPGFGHVLDDDQRWAAIDYIRAHNAGEARRSLGQWSTPLQAPGFDAECGPTPRTWAELRGTFVLLHFGAAASPAPDGTLGVLAGVDARAIVPGGCVSRDAAVPLAYAIVSGIDPVALRETEFLIDDQGWLRAAQRTGDKALQAQIRSLRAHPVTNAGVSTTMMPMDMKM